MIQSLRTQTYRLMILYVIFLAAIIAVFSKYILVNRLNELENTAATQQLSTVSRNIQSELGWLSSVARDWAPWDDTYAFLAGNNKHYVDDNLSNESLANLKVNWFLLIDAAGKIRLQREFDISRGQAIQTNTNLQQFVDLNPGLLHRFDARAESLGILSFNNIPYLIASAPVLTSRSEGPALGTLLIARALDSAEMENIRPSGVERITYLPIPGLNAHPQDWQAYQTILQTRQPTVIAANLNTLYGYTLIDDVYGNPGILIRATFSRHLFGSAINSLILFAVLSSLTGLGVGFWFMFRLDNDILTRVENITGIVKQVASTSDLSPRIEIKKRDELGILSEQINVMLEQLQRSSAVLQEHQAHLAYEASHDVLTGFANRSFFLDQVDAVLHRMEYSAEPPMNAVLFLDLDQFKLVNDSFDHLTGDQLLVNLGRRLKASLAGVGLLARLGGDEFALLLENIPSLDFAIDIVKQIEHTLSTPFLVRDHSIFITASTGIAIPQAGERAEDVLRNADLAMYEAKARGKARYVVFDESLYSSSRSQLSLQNEIRSGLERREFTVFYQPIVDFVTHQVIAAEALVRWQHPQRGLLPPSEFLYIAEENNLIVPLSEWIIHTAFLQTQELRADPDTPPIKVAINLSYRQFQQPGFLHWVQRQLAETGARPDWVDFELTENAVIQEFDHTLQTLNEFKTMGFHLSLDDFGTGYSSLEQIKYLPVDTLKIDRTFISGVLTPSQDQAVVAAIIQMAQLLGMRTIAEGVEDQEQEGFLGSLGCHQGQGYLYARPMPFEQLKEYLKKTAK